MNAVRKLYQLIWDYYEEKININYFTDNFTITFNTEVDYDELSEAEYKLFEELAHITSRYSPYEEERKKYPYYYDELDTLNKVKEVIDKLSS
ncbi:hypothetical protein P4571_02660 [Niallia alba]|uniref:hypothetical protein n=1 Tax=Niallia alba TaxID=2729105 RepID=UPI002E214FDE|nr:hypothetical protein [Niallia alba]